MVLVQKWPFFQLFFLRNIDQKNVFSDMIERKNEFVRYKSEKLKKSKNRYFSSGVNLWFWSKNGHFCNFFFFPIQTRKMYSMRFQNRKTPCQAIKARSLESRKIDIFPKRLTRGFGPKMAIFPTFLFQAKQTRKMYSMIFWNEKTSFQAKNTRRSKSRKIDLLPKG